LTALALNLALQNFI